MNTSWNDILETEKEKPYYQEMMTHIKEARSQGKKYSPKKRMCLLLFH